MYRQHLELHVFPMHRHLFVILWHMTQQVHNESAYSVIIHLAVILLAKSLHNVVKRRCAYHIIAVRRYLLYLLRFIIIFVLNTTHDSFKQILHSNDTGCSAVIVHHNCYLCLIFSELFEKLTTLVAFRHKGYISHKLLYRTFFFILFKNQPEQVLCEYNTTYVVGIVAVNRYSRKALAYNKLHSLRKRGIFFYGNHFCAVCHNFTNFDIVKIKNVAYHFRLTFLDAARFVYSVHHHEYLLLSDRVCLVCGLNAEQP